MVDSKENKKILNSQKQDIKKNEVEKPPKDEQMKQIDKPPNQKTKRQQFNKNIAAFLDKIIPSFDPPIKIKKKLTENEEVKDKSKTIFFSEINFLLGLSIIVLGAFLSIFYDTLYLVILIMGVIITVTSYEIEEVYITNIRLLVRRIGLVERVIRIPSDEEHLLRHIVSFNIGRAPVQWILTSIGLFGLFGASFVGGNTLLQISLFASSAVLLYLGLRLGKRILTINLAGGHTVLLGKRKGIPVHIIESMLASTLMEIA